MMVDMYSIGTMQYNVFIPKKFQGVHSMVATKEELFDLYVNQKLSLRDIGKKFDVSHKKIGRILEGYGIPRRSRNEVLQARSIKRGIPDLKYDELKEMLDKGMIMREIAEHYGMRSNLLSQKLKKLGLHDLARENFKKYRSKYIKKNPIPQTEEDRMKNLQLASDTRRDKLREGWWKISEFDRYADTARRFSQREYNWGKDVPKGMEIDHIFSVSDGWRYGIYVEDISHPNNLRLLNANENWAKNKYSNITFEEFMKLVPEARFFRDKLPNPVCVDCGKEFESRSNKRKHCSDECYFKHWHLRNKHRRRKKKPLA